VRHGFNSENVVTAGESVKNVKLLDGPPGYQGHAVVQLIEVLAQAGRSQVRFQMVSLEFSIDIILPAALWSWGLTQPLTEMSTRNIS